MLQSVMDTNQQPNSPLMRKLQEALERDLIAAAHKPPQAEIQNNPLRTQTVATPPTTRMPPATVPRPHFTSAAISKGDYIEPQAENATPEPAFAEEDMTLEELHANSRSRRGGIILASSVILAGAAAVAAFMFILTPQQEVTGPVPEIVAAPAPATVPPEAPAPDLRTIEPTGTAEASPSVSMGDVSSELVPPTTDGLSPARRISTMRILLNGDKEVRP